MAEPANEGGQLPLSALLSQVLVAFIIECDNEFERQVPHRTSDHDSTASRGGGPWLVSMAMWWTCMRFVGEEGISVGELGRRADTGTNLPGMQRWGYIRIEPDPADTRPRPPRSDWVIRATPAGRNAQEVWRPLTGAIERAGQRVSAKTRSRTCARRSRRWPPSLTRRGGRWRVVRLTPQGRSAQNKFRERIGDVENRWRARFGGPAIGALREALERLTGDPAKSPLRLTGDPARSPLFAGLEPPPGGWRGSVRRPATLPYYPMVLHRGGFPDGS